MKTMTRAEAAEYFRTYNDYTILTHRRPDGDTLGSAAALCLGLRKLGKNAWVLNPTEALDNMGWLMADITKDFADNGDTIVAVDVAAPNMLPKDFAELAESWATADFLTVRISQIESRILSACSAMVTDIGGTQINGVEANLVLGADSIPVRGAVNG